MSLSHVYTWLSFYIPNKIYIYESFILMNRFFKTENDEEEEEFSYSCIDFIMLQPN